MTIQSKNTVELVFSNGTLVLPRPIINDTRSIRFTRINRNTRGLQRKMYSDNDWYKLIVHDYIFRNLTLTLKDAFLEAVTLDLGKAITVVDYMSTSRLAYIEDVASSIEVRNDQCSYTVGLVLREVL